MISFQRYNLTTGRSSNHRRWAGFYAETCAFPSPVNLALVLAASSLLRATWCDLVSVGLVLGIHAEEFLCFKGETKTILVLGRIVYHHP